MSGCDLTHAFYYSDSFFTHPATQYDHQLALATLGLVCAAANTVASDAEYWVNGSVGREAHIAAAYETLGFEDALFYNYDLDTGRAGDFERPAYHPCGACPAGRRLRRRVGQQLPHR